MSDMDDIEQSIMAALRKAYQLGLDDARNRIAELEAELAAVEAENDHFRAQLGLFGEGES